MFAYNGLRLKLQRPFTILIVLLCALVFIPTLPLVAQDAAVLTVSPGAETEQSIDPESTKSASFFPEDLLAAPAPETDISLLEDRLPEWAT